MYILDGHGFIFRSYYAHFRNPLINSKGDNTSAVFGFFQAIKKVFDNYKPSYFVVALDSKGDTFRNEMYSEYKANRDKAPDDLIAQIPIIIDILKTLHIPHIATPNMEADDIIASLVHKATGHNIPSTIISSDKDLFQLLSDTVGILRPTSKSTEWEPITPDWLKREWQLKPEQVRDYLAIVGDTSDNVPGIKGLGPKSAVSLLMEHNDLQTIFEQVDTIKETWRKKLYEHKAMGLLSYDLVSLKNDIALPDIDSFQYDEVLWEYAKPLFAEQEIYAFHKKQSSQSSQTSPAPANNQHAYNNTDNANPNVLTPDFSNTDTKYKTNTTSPHIYTLIHNEESLRLMMDTIHTNTIISIDTETDSLDTLTAIPVGISISIKAHSGWYIPLSFPAQERSPITLKEQHIKNAIQTLFDGARTIVMHNMKFDIAILKNWGIDFTKIAQCVKKHAVLFDTMIAAWMCNKPRTAYAMDGLAKLLLGYSPIAYKSLTDDENNPVSVFSKVPLPQAVEYAVEDADITLQLYVMLLDELTEKNLLDSFFHLEMPLVLLLSEIERYGLSLDTDLMADISNTLAKEIITTQECIYTHSEEEFNINSPKQLQGILFEKLGLKPIKKNKTGFSTDVGVLEQLLHHHSIIKEILHYRHISKLKSTYTDALPQQIHPLTKRVHTSLQQTGTETGRIASINPNLQNIPVKDDWGKQIRAAFIAPKGSMLISADYSQIELMVLAHLSNDSNMIEAFNNNIDIHKRTASILFHIKETAVSKEQRTIAKSINFGVIYGMSPFRLGNDLGIPHKEAKSFIESYFSEFAGVTQFIADTIAKTKQAGHTTTLMGHKRTIPDIGNSNANLRKRAERMAVNSTIQGSAAEIVKVAMLKVHAVLEKKKLMTKIILQIHDELLFESPQKEVETALPLIKKTMEQAVSLAVPLQVSISSGKNWGSLK